LMPPLLIRHFQLMIFDHAIDIEAGWLRHIIDSFSLTHYAITLISFQAIDTPHADRAAAISWCLYINTLPLRDTPQADIAPPWWLTMIAIDAAIFIVRHSHYIFITPLLTLRTLTARHYYWWHTLSHIDILFSLIHWH
jgi:hypothetical protein